ncbi:MAG: ATP synthase F1 subunit gamma [Acholeplasmataceae bacterium]|nr:ATP synthase F1 subunit gamma [Acholeplasmataceae bacterium]
MGLKDIKMRMVAINKTASITQAMHNIALSKIKKSGELLNRTRDFVIKLHSILEYANRSNEDVHRLTSVNEGKTKLYVLVTSDRGLAGSYHNQLFKAFLDEVKDIPKKDYRVFVLGKKGFYFAQKRKLPMVNEAIIYNRDDITAMYFRPYADLIKDVFMEGAVDEVILFYNHYINTATQTVKKRVILPVIFDEEEKSNEDFIYDTSPEVVLNHTVNIYIESSIFTALADAKLSEHASRMIAMKSATDNANEIVERLHTIYHRARQQEITSEIIDVVNGSNV